MTPVSTSGYAIAVPNGLIMYWGEVCTKKRTAEM